MNLIYVPQAHAHASPISSTLFPQERRSTSFRARHLSRLSASTFHFVKSIRSSLCFSRHPFRNTANNGGNIGGWLGRALGRSSLPSILDYSSRTDPVSTPSAPPRPSTFFATFRSRELPSNSIEKYEDVRRKQYAEEGREERGASYLEKSFSLSFLS